MPTNPNEKILVVVNDPAISDLIVRQALQPCGYQVSLVEDGSNAIRQALEFQPDVMIINNNLPGLSGKDLLVALSSQGLSVPTIVMAEKGQENSLLQAFRLGASDYLMLPVREAEVIACVEHALGQLRETRNQAAIAALDTQTSLELQKRLLDVGKIHSVGRVLLSIMGQRALFEKIVESLTSVTGSDLGWLTLKDEKTKTFVLAAQRNLPVELASKIGQPIAEADSPLAAFSAESLSLQGSQLDKFNLSNLGSELLLIPLKVRNETVGQVILIRRFGPSFNANEQELAEGITDYASIALIHEHLHHSLSQSAEIARQAEKRADERLERLRLDIRANLAALQLQLESITAGEPGLQSSRTQETLESSLNTIKRLLD